MTRAEIQWVLIASLAVLLLSSVPTLHAWSLDDADHVFTGFVYNTQDGNSYIAKMRLGARGEWLFRLPFTTEPHPGAWLYTFHMLLGKIAAGLGLSHPLVYHMARVILGLGLLISVYAFIAHFVPDAPTRRLAWALVAVGSGLGWLLTALGATGWLGDLPLDFWVPEAYVFLVLYSLPHLALAETALIWALLLVLRAFASGSPGGALLAGLAALVMAIIVPFYPLVLAAIVGVYLSIRALRVRKMPWREVGLAALMGAFTVPVLVYNIWLTSAEPAYATWASQLYIPSPHPVHYLLGYAPLILPALWGLRALRTQGAERRTPLLKGDWLLPIAWMLAAPVLAYLPFTAQRRLVVLAQVPLAMLAALGLQAWLGSKRWVLGVYVAASSLSIVMLVGGSLGPIHERQTPIYRPGAEAAALQWLDKHSATYEAVLASFEVGNVIPARTDLRAFAGHGPETLNSTEKEAMIRRLFQPESDDAWRQALLERFGVNYVLYGPQERALGDWDPAVATYLTAIYDKGGYTIYSVTGMGLP